MTTSLKASAEAEGCALPNGPVYYSLALETVSVEDIYQGNLTRLSALRTKYDPEASNIMGRTGGFRIPDQV